MLNVVRDSRERNPWTFGSFKSVASVVSKKLDTGDYSVQGLEEILIIERKGAITEFAKNVTEKRFWRSLDRMSGYSHAYLVLEFTELDILKYPKGSGLPPKLWNKVRVRGKFMMSCIKKIEDAGIKIIFCNNRDEAEHSTVEIMERVWNEQCRKQE